MYAIINARIHTLDPRRPFASALAIRGDRILLIGDDHEILAELNQVDSKTGGIYNAGGRTILPGLTDAHIHLHHYALSLQKVDCETASREECLQRVKERAQTTQPGEWVLGHGWNQNSWPGGFGTSRELDKAVGDHPTFLTAKSLHAAWANSAALRLAGVNRHTPDPEGGRIGRDENGDPDGILFETAMDLVADVIPEPTLVQVVQAIREAQPGLWRMGLTGVHDFDRSRCFQALQVLHRQSELRLRVLKSLPIEYLNQVVELGLRTGFGDDFLRLGSLKAFADGALGPHTAAMLEPYENEPESRGMLMLDGEELFELGRRAVEQGLSLAVHAIGDRANHEVLEAYERLRRYEREDGLASLRHRIEHVQLLHPSDISRLADLGVIASMQPIHASSDMDMADHYWGARSAHAYAWRSQQDNEAVLAFGSDAPVESPNPFWGLHAAVTRQKRDGSPGPDGWYPEQRLSFAQALHGFTTGAAFAAGMEDRLGKLSPGYLADLLLLDTDPFTLDPSVLHTLQPSAVMVGGQWVVEP